MFKRYVLVAHELQFNPLTLHANAWEFMEAVHNGMSYRVWAGKLPRGPVAMKGMAFVFKISDAAWFEYNRVHELSRAPDTIKPKLYVVSSFSSRAALVKVLDHVHLKRVTGAEQIA